MVKHHDKSGIKVMEFLSDATDQVLGEGKHEVTTNLKDVSSIVHEKKNDANTCYAYNVATIIRATQKRNNLPVTSYDVLLRKILNKYGIRDRK